MRNSLKKFAVLMAAVLLWAAAPAGCITEEESKSAGGITLVDLLGREVLVDGAAERIISLSPGNTEIVFALGLEDKLFGVTDYCDYPPEAAEKENVGGFDEPNIEVILALQPDLVLAGADSMHQGAVARFEEREIPVLVMDPRTVEEVYEAIRLVGVAAGVEEEAAALLGQIEQQISAVQEKTATLDDDQVVSVYYELWYDPPMSVGNHSFIHEVIEVAGGKNIFADVADNYPEVSPEAVAERNPQVILYPDDHGTAEMMMAQFYSRAGWSEIAALKEERIYNVDPDRFNRPGPRTGHAVEETAALFYPELFDGR